MNIPTIAIITTAATTAIIIVTRVIFVLAVKIMFELTTFFFIPFIFCILNVATISLPIFNLLTIIQYLFNNDTTFFMAIKFSDPL